MSCFPRQTWLPEQVSIVTAGGNPSGNWQGQKVFYKDDSSVGSDEDVQQEKSVDNVDYDLTRLTTLTAINDLKKLLESILESVEKNTDVVNKLALTTENNAKKMHEQFVGLASQLRNKLKTLAQTFSQSLQEQTRELGQSLQHIVELSKNSDEQLVKIVQLLDRSLPQVMNNLEMSNTVNKDGFDKVAKVVDAQTQLFVQEFKQVIASSKKSEEVLNKLRDFFESGASTGFMNRFFELQKQHADAMMQEIKQHKAVEEHSGLVNSVIRVLRAYPMFFVTGAVTSVVTLVRKYCLAKYSALLEGFHWSLYMPQSLIEAIKKDDETEVIKILDQAMLEQYAGLLDDLDVKRRRARFLIDVRKEFEALESYDVLVNKFGFLNKILQLPSLDNKELRKKRLKILHELCLKHWEKIA